MPFAYLKKTIKNHVLTNGIPMAEKDVLSQEEIDALLESVDDAPAEAAEAKEAAPAQEKSAQDAEGEKKPTSEKDGTRGRVERYHYRP